MTLRTCSFLENLSGRIEEPGYGEPGEEASQGAGPGSFAFGGQGLGCSSATNFLVSRGHTKGVSAKETGWRGARRETAGAILGAGVCHLVQEPFKDCRI